MSRPTVDQVSKQFGIRKFGCFDDVSKIYMEKSGHFGKAKRKAFGLLRL